MTGSRSASPLLVTGARGQVGSDLRRLGAGTRSVVGHGSADLDITDAVAVRSAVAEFAGTHPGGVLVNCAAYTAVDNAEGDRATAYAVNATGAGLLAAAAAEHGLGLIHLSTDYVFAGDGTAPYEPTDPTGPHSVYGASKLEGERLVQAAHPGAHIVRTAWVYGAVGSNFVKTMCALEASRPTVSVVADQVGSPTWSADLAAGLIELADLEIPGGVVHATNAGETSWFEFTRAIFTELGADPDRVTPTTSASFVRPAPRPSYSVLSTSSWIEAGLTPLRTWRSALTAAFVAHGDVFRPTE